MPRALGRNAPEMLSPKLDGARDTEIDHSVPSWKTADSPISRICHSPSRIFVRSGAAADASDSVMPRVSGPMPSKSICHRPASITEDDPMMHRQTTMVRTVSVVGSYVTR